MQKNQKEKAALLERFFPAATVNFFIDLRFILRARYMIIHILGLLA